MCNYDASRPRVARRAWIDRSIESIESMRDRHPIAMGYNLVRMQRVRSLVRLSTLVVIGRWVSVTDDDPARDARAAIVARARGRDWRTRRGVPLRGWGIYCMRIQTGDASRPVAASRAADRVGRRSSVVGRRSSSGRRDVDIARVCAAVTTPSVDDVARNASHRIESPTRRWILIFGC